MSKKTLIALVVGLCAFAAGLIVGSELLPQGQRQQPLLTTPGTLLFDGNFNTGGFAPFVKPQCANYGTVSKSPRLRGTFNIENSLVGDGAYAVRIVLPASQPPAYPLEACDATTPQFPLPLGQDLYYGLMVYVPPGWTTGTNAFYGVQILETDFQNVFGAPVSLQLHPDHVTLSLEMGACSNHSTTSPHCDWRSQADLTRGPNLPPEYAIPRGKFIEGQWNEIIIHVHVASDASGKIEAWHRLKGKTAWSQSASLSGYPTVQWDRTMGCCYPTANDQFEAYSGGASAPVSVWLDNYTRGTSFAVVAATMP